MSQQKYIYPPLTLASIEALYNDPYTSTGFSTIQGSITQNQLVFDRSVTDVLELPYNEYEITIRPSELVTSASIYNIIDRLHDNFLYLNTRATIASNILPGNYTGYYYTDTDTRTPSFSSNGVLPVTLPKNSSSLGKIANVTPSETAVDDELINHPVMSDGDEPGASLDMLVTGAFVRDNSLIDTSTSSLTAENYHLGFVGSTDKLVVVKMSTDQQSASPWELIQEYSTVQDLPGTLDASTPTNTIKYTNINKIKTDSNKNIYILDRGTSDIYSPGIDKISTDSTRSVLYKYDMTGYIEPENANIIQKNRRVLSMTLGDLNTNTNESDIIDPVTFTVRDSGEIILYDEFDFTFKRFDGIGNFLGKHPKRSVFFRGAPGTKKTYLGMSDIHFDEYTKTLYVLCPNGSIFTFDEQFKQKDTISIPKQDSNQSTNITTEDREQTFFTDMTSLGHGNNEKFLQLEFSKNENNLYYILSNNRVVKRFKSRLTRDSIGNFDLLSNNIGTHVDFDGATTFYGYRAHPLFISTLQEANVVTKEVIGDDGYTTIVVDPERTYLYDQMYMYTGFLGISDVDPGFATTIAASDLTEQLIDRNGDSVRCLTSFRERINYRSCLIEDEYSIYEISSTTSITHKEYSSDMVYNKLIHKLLANHTKMIELINYRLQSIYTTSGELVFDRRTYLEEQEYRDMILDIDDNYYVGINEYLATGTINRCFTKIHETQQAILNILQMRKANNWPSRQGPVYIEPYLHTDGSEYVDIDSKSYTGYYYIQTQSNGDIYITGRNSSDGAVNVSDKTPTTDRYLTIVTG